MELRLCSACHAFQEKGATCATCRAPLTLADETRFLGETFGKYRLDAVLGAGGMGVVYRATHATLGRVAALKVVMPHGDDGTFRARFLREARVLAELEHPNIVEIYDFDVSAWGFPYFVMEHLAGFSLRELTDRKPGPIAPEVVGELVAEMAAGLAFAHRRGIVHRDLKPHNVFVALYDGRPVVKLLDFGLAKVVTAEHAGATELTSTGAIVGTPGYLSPEHVSGENIGPHTDQHSLALIAAELLVGKAVRAGRSVPQILGEDVRQPIPRAYFPPGLAPPTADALRRATDPSFAARFPDVLAFVQALSLPRSEQALAAMAEEIGGAAAPNRPAPSAPRPSASSPFESTILASESSLVRTGPAGPRAVAPRKGRVPLFALALTVVVSLAAVAVAVGLASRRAPVASAPSASAPPPSMSPPPPPPPARADLLLSPLHEVSLPADAVLPLGVHDDTLILSAGDHLYLPPVDGSRPAATLPLAPCTRTLGATSDGHVFCRDDRAVYLVDPFASADASDADRRRVWAADLPKLDPDAARAGEPLLVSATGEHLAVVGHAAVEVYAVAGGKLQHRFGVPVQPGGALGVTLTDRAVAVVEPAKEARAFAIADGHALLRKPFPEAGSQIVAALSPDGDALAVGGFFDRVYVYALAAGATDAVVPRAGQSTALAWIPDTPTLVVAGTTGVFLARHGAAVSSATWSDGSAVDRLRVTSRGILAVRDGLHAATLLAYRGMTIPAPIPAGRHEIWAVAAPASGDSVYLGGSDGTLLAYGDGGVASQSLHTEGITALAIEGDRLVSASDDKTVAVWRLPALRVEWRARAHEFLVNKLLFAGAPPLLYTSSSDGTLKLWQWPELELREAIDTRALSKSKKKYSLHAFWVSPEGDRILAGTWNHALLVLTRRGGAWSAVEREVTSGSLYQAVSLPGVRAVLFLGIAPFRAYLYDLDSGALGKVDLLGANVYAAVGDPSGSEARLLGEGAVLRYAFSRGDGGAIAYSVSMGLDTDLAPVTAAARMGDGRIAAATNEGSLYLLDASLPGTAPVLREVVAP